MHPIPDEALSQHTAILGMTGMGKSYCARTIVESFLDQRRRVCILDYTGVWSGLRSNASGKGEGYPVVIFGGEDGDVPLNDAAGAAVARFVAGGDQPTVVDLDGMTVGAQQRFVTAFCEELYRTNRRALHLVFEECDELAPQTGAPGAERMIGAVARIFQRGRKKGFRAIAITQRPANLHKRVLAQCKTMVALRLVAPQDRKAVAEWVRGHGDEAEGKEIMASLPKLARGEGWVWAPEQGVLERVRFPAIRTFDTMRAPDGEDHRPAKWAAVDLDGLRKEMAALVKEARENDPGELKAEIARLKTEIQKTSIAKTDAIDPVAVQKAEQRGYDRGREEGIRIGRDIGGRQAAHRQMTRVIEALAGAAMLNGDQDAISGVLPTMRSIEIEQPASGSPLPDRPQRQAPERRTLPEAEAATPVLPPGNPPPVASGGGTIGAERRPLSVLAAAYPAGMTEGQWAVAAGMKRSGGTWAAYKSRLRSAGRIEQSDGIWRATESGIAALGGRIEPMPAPGPELVEFWASRISGVGPMLRYLADIYPRFVTRDALAHALSMSASGGTFAAYLSRLRGPGLIEQDEGRRIRAAAALMGT